jgi:hypothetical protein
MIDHWKNDFLICSQAIKKYEDQLIFESKGLWCYSGMETVISQGEASIIIFGRVYDIQNIEYSKSEIADKIREHWIKGDVEIYLAKLSGRFLVLYNKNEQSYLYPDACAMLSSYHGQVDNLQVVSSSIQLANNALDLKESISEETRNFLQSDTYVKNGHYWIGDQSIDQKYSLLLANHILTFPSLAVVRRNIKVKDEDVSYHKKVDKFATLMINSLRAVSDKNLMIPITAGIDSRIIYAASKHVDLNVEYYLFDTGGNDSDLKIGSEICKSGGDELTVYKEPEPSQKFINDYNSLFYFTTEKDRISHYYHHFVHDSNRMNVNGNGGDIFRGHYDYFSFKNLKSILKYSGYKEAEIFNDTLKKWCQSIPLESGLTRSDHLYWEQKTSNWFGRYQYEKNFFIEDYSPYNNLKILQLGFSVPFKKRRAYNLQFQKDVIDLLFPQINKYPINPGETLFDSLKLRIFKNYYLWWLLKKAAHLR